MESSPLFFDFVFRTGRRAFRAEQFSYMYFTKIVNHITGRDKLSFTCLFSNHFWVFRGD